MPYADTDKAREYQRHYRRRQRAAEGSTGKSTSFCTTLPDDFRVRTAKDVLSLLDDQVDALLADESLSTIERARTVAYLSGVILRAIDAGDTAERIEALEAVLKNRKSAANRNRKK